jgi:hypothetical protein
MFEIGDKVELLGFDKPIFGRIVAYYYDEGNVWEVVTDGGNRHDCCDDDLIPAK